MRAIIKPLTSSTKSLIDQLYNLFVRSSVKRNPSSSYPSTNPLKLIFNLHITDCVTSLSPRLDCCHANNNLSRFLLAEFIEQTIQLFQIRSIVTFVFLYSRLRQIINDNNKRSLDKVTFGFSIDKFSPRIIITVQLCNNLGNKRYICFDTTNYFH